MINCIGESGQDPGPPSRKKEKQAVKVPKEEGVPGSFKAQKDQAA